MKSTDFSLLNLDLIDFETFDDKACIDAINNLLLTNYFKQYPELNFSAMMTQIGSNFSFYGYNGFHRGFGDLMASLLIKEIKEDKRGSLK